MDVRCFTLKNAFDNIAISAGTKQNSAIMEFGLEENYLMIIHNNIPIITDIFLRPQEKQNISETTETQISSECESVIRRYAMQIKQAINEYETKYESVPDGINIYSFALNPREHQPSGTCNFSRIDNARLVQGTGAAIEVYAVNYNVLRIMSGMGGLAYSN